jgi:hypothetical protein
VSRYGMSGISESASAAADAHHQRSLICWVWLTTLDSNHKSFSSSACVRAARSLGDLTPAVICRNLLILFDFTGIGTGL